jgi:uncharacterized protein (UPF0332 family)
MGIAQDLLKQAHHLATYEGSSPTQASLRRAVSAAYYAVFHLLLEEAALRWQGSPEGRHGLQRAFNHGPMKTASLQFRKEVWQDWNGKLQRVPPAIQHVAGAFVDLQEERHTADYYNHEQWSATEVEAVLNTATGAFQHWQSIRSDPMAGNYLLAMLLRKQH